MTTGPREAFGDHDEVVNLITFIDSLIIKIVVHGNNWLSLRFCFDALYPLSYVSLTPAMITYILYYLIHDNIHFMVTYVIYISYNVIIN